MKKQNVAVRVRVKTKVIKFNRRSKRTSLFSKLFSRANYVFKHVFIED